MANYAELYFTNGSRRAWMTVELDGNDISYELNVDQAYIDDLITDFENTSGLRFDNAMVSGSGQFCDYMEQFV